MKKKIALIAFTLLQLIAAQLLTAQVSYEVTAQAIQGYYSQMTTNRLYLGNGFPSQNNVGAVIYFYTNEQRWGQLKVVSHGSSLLLDWATYNTDGSLWRHGVNLRIEGGYSGDLDGGVGATGSFDFYWENFEGYLVPKNGAKFVRIFLEKIPNNTNPSTTASPIVVPRPIKTNPKRFVPKGATPNSSAYFQADFKSIRAVASEMGQYEEFGGAEESPLHLQAGSILYYKTSKDAFGKMQIMNFGMGKDTLAECYIRWTTYKPDGSGVLKAKEYEDLFAPNSFDRLHDLDGSQSTGFDFRWEIRDDRLFITARKGAKFYLLPAGETTNTASSQAEKTVKEPVVPAKPDIKTDPANNHPQRRLALIIGNAAYPDNAALRNPVNDATDIATALREMGFEVITTTNANRQKMEATIEDFGSRLKNYNLGFFYYAGHGVQIDGENYLIPVDAKLKSQGEVRYECYPVGRVLAKMEEAAIQANVIVLDACRDNPFARSWSRSLVSGGLANINAPQGTFIGFATSPGSTAADGEGRNGVYTAALLEHLRKPNLTLDQLFNAVSGSVKKKTNNLQVPWKASSMSEDLYLRN